VSDLGDIYAKRIGAIRRDLQWICDRWEDVHELRLKGTPRPWREPSISPEARAELDRLARIEKIDREGLTMGESPAPVHIDVLDTLAEILMRSDMLAEHVAGSLGVERLDHAASAFDDAEPFLRFVDLHLAEFAEDDPDGMDAVSDVARELKAEMGRVLGEVYDGQLLTGLCPFCDGRDDRHPSGGARTMRVRLVWMPRPDDRDHHEACIVCVGGMCEPSEQQCGLWLKGLPAWPFAEWDWLAGKIDTAV
jgi:hypothetical protein